jgi:hypothetical protein
MKSMCSLGPAVSSWRSLSSTGRRSQGLWTLRFSIRNPPLKVNAVVRCEPN